jgi:hypothetical protein
VARPRTDERKLRRALVALIHVADHLDIIIARQGALHNRDERSLLEALAAQQETFTAQDEVTGVVHLARDRERK